MLLNGKKQKPNNIEAENWEREKKRQRDKERQKRYREDRKDDPQYRKEERERKKRYREDRRDDPKYRKEERERHKRYRQDRRDDPKYRKEEQERHKRYKSWRKETESPEQAAERKKKDNLRRKRNYENKSPEEKEEQRLKWRIQNKRRKEKIIAQKLLRNGEILRRQKTEGLSNTHSFLIHDILQRKASGNEMCELEVAIDFIKELFRNFDDLAYLMMPNFNKKKKSVRLSIDFPQAMRIFFGKTVRTEDGRAVRPAYGLISILKTTGVRPYDLRVRPFNSKITTIIGYLENAVTPFLKGTRYEGCLFDFNFMETKLYFGNNFVKDNSNKTVGPHTDCRFNDYGQQLESDSARGDHLTLVLSIGEPRLLYFVRCHKTQRETCWGESRANNDNLHLLHNSLFVLFPEDEIPTFDESDNLLKKTKHGVKFDGNNFSIALVFRAVKKFANFYTGVTDSNEQKPYKNDSWDYNSQVPGASRAGDLSDFLAAKHFEKDSLKKAFKEAEANVNQDHLSDFGERVITVLTRLSEKT